MQKLQDPLDRTDWEIRDWIQCVIGDEYIYPKCYDKRNIFTDDIFL